MFAEVVSVSAPTSVSAAGGPDCHLMSGCGFPAPGAEIFVFEDIFTLQLASLEFGFSKVTVLLLLGVVAGQRLRLDRRQLGLVRRGGCCGRAHIA